MVYYLIGFAVLGLVFWPIIKSLAKDAIPRDDEDHWWRSIK
ncbi:hypothetical protein [Bradyrhizobium pachyrhizi]|nr:hypothetical protein [Bradyrhizobium pachyrhizi]